MTSEMGNIREEAISFIEMTYQELGKSQEEIQQRIEDIEQQLKSSGTYQHTAEELAYGAKLAWRNNSRCIGRLFWDSLVTFDERSLQSTDDIAEALFRHIQYATNEGRIRPVITIFAPDKDIRLWNHQLIRYAGYETPEGIIGDPASLEFTQRCQELGWQGHGTPFDILPLVIQIGQHQPKWFMIPDEMILRVPLRHPDVADFTQLGLEWYAVPIISDMALEVGGIRYTAAPFNGWYMETEIGARNLADKDRYNQLPAVADLLGLQRESNTSLWMDRALVELNIAVLHSFKENQVSIVDHHTAAAQFMTFSDQEQAQGRELNARWSWLIPPLSPATTPVWHHSYKEREVSPNYVYQSPAYHDDPRPQVNDKKDTHILGAGCPFHS
ncbi:nitric-oxide synthase [Paenibacillus shirakamiensis]|uniref:Nitric oxide synthase oxygenase n=1 Tax=Paenibacillus shirakamiensis TaxID=1265935 RepID=A0ABS4JK71_9BACL|nr:nitric oxide synthase oxygenase [Paenibacillus shirakamiensis]MBP2002100.1 nitric-oxide synthase [Paenibacillus shirakamiensis]